VALLPYPEMGDLNEETRDLIGHFETEHGRPSLLRRMLAWFPPALNVADAMYHPFMENGQLPRPLKELIVVATSNARGCSYCAGGHSRFLVDEFGYTQDFVEKARVGETVEGLPERERALVQFTLKLATDTPKMVPKDIDTLRGHGWSTQEIFEAVVMTMHSAFTNVLAAGLHLEDDVTVEGYF
jgi:uncharacterized peroxidase-related enzyme